MKYYGTIGFSETTETTEDGVPTGVWTEVITERNYYGDVIRNTRRIESGEGINDNIQINNQISIVADPYALNELHAMRYITWMGTKWKVSSVDVSYPRLILTIGGVYNG